jgi:predicted nucleic acid-binding protein
VIVPDIVIQDCSDPDDNRILETAVFSAADSIVTGDKHLLQMNPYRSIKIKVSEFLGSIASREI